MSANHPANGTPPPLPEQWPDRRTAAAALGLTPRQLGTLAGKGAPVPEDGPIFAGVLIWWLWQNRGLCPLPRAEERELKLRHERMELQNLKLSQRHLDEAQRLIARRLQRARQGLQQRLGGPGSAGLLRAAQGHPHEAAPQLQQHILREFDAAIAEALK